MAIELVTQYLPYVDEIFTTESKKALLTNNAFTWDGAHTVKVYKVGTAPMNDYGRTGPGVGLWSRYGEIKDLDATTETMMLAKDRSFTFTIDALDKDETKQALDGASALARQIREVVVPEVDTYTIEQMAEHAGTKASAAALTAENIYDAIITGSNVLDNAEAPETGRVLVVTPDTYKVLKQSKDVNMDTDVANEMRLRGVIGMVDGMPVVRVPASRMPSGFGFMIAHPVATVAPTKLADYRTHSYPPGINGVLVEGRICYDAFVLENKATAIYYHPIA